MLRTEAGAQAQRKPTAPFPTTKATSPLWGPRGLQQPRGAPGRPSSFGRALSQGPIPEALPQCPLHPFFSSESAGCCRVLFTRLLRGRARAGLTGRSLPGLALRPRGEPPAAVESPPAPGRPSERGESGGVSWERIGQWDETGAIPLPAAAIFGRPQRRRRRPPLAAAVT